MTWTTWTTATAAGRGTFWKKLCKPNCADGKTGYYPVTVALSAVRTSAQGRWFRTLTVTWAGTRPPASTPDSYELMAPGD
jgi:hypothetical protein